MEREEGTGVGRIAKRGEFSRIDGYFDLDELCCKKVGGESRNCRLRQASFFPFFSSLSLSLFLSFERKRYAHTRSFYDSRNFDSRR